METVNTKKSKVVTRSYSSDEEVQASSFPRSSFSNSYHNAFDGIIGRIIPSSVFDVLPKSQYRGVHSGAIQLERMVTPFMPDTTAHSFTFYCSCRAVDRDYVETAAPSIGNRMGETLSFPSFDVAVLARSLFSYITSRYTYVVTGASITDFTPWYYLVSHFHTMSDQDKIDWIHTNLAGISVQDGLPSMCLNYWPQVYLTGLAYDFDQYFKTFLKDEFIPSDSDLCNAIYHTLVRFMEYGLGRGSLMDFLGYPILDTTMPWPYSTSASVLLTAWRNMFFTGHEDNPTICNEYRLRQLAAIWIEYFRQPMLQPLNAHLRYNKWDSVSHFTPASKMSDFTIHPQTAMMLLFMRAVPFGEDRVTTAHVDDICRNVYAPVVSTLDGKVSTIPSGISANPQDIHSGFETVLLHTKRPDGTSISVNCPVPSMIGNFMNRVGGVDPTTTNTLALDLQTLKTANRLERELKRRMWFGDSYFDVVRADYDCDISDADVLKPHLLSDGMSSIIGATQEIASTDGGNDSPRGTRTAVAQGDYPSEAYAGFAQETGSVISLFYLTQRVSYDPADDFNFVRTYSDMVRPIYAGTNESIMHKFSVNRHANNALGGYGFEPYGNYYRTRLDRAHGKFLKEYKDYVALRDSKVVQLTSDYNQQYQLPLGHFADTIMLDGQFNVLATHEFFVTHSLPAPVEII